MKIRKLNEFEAQQWALWSLAGIPNLEIAAAFLPAGTPEEELQVAADQWPRQTEVTKAVKELIGGDWESLSKERRWELGCEKMYADMSYFLWSHNYNELQGAEKQKADTCLQALERKLSGTQGEGSVLERVYEDLAKAYRQQASASARPKLN